MQEKIKLKLLFTAMLCIFTICLVSCSKSDTQTKTDTSVLTYGSAAKPVGRTVVISCFANDKNTSWQGGANEKEKLLKNLKIAAEWIQEQGKTYGKDVEFIYDWKENKDLIFETSFSEDMVNMPENGDYLAWGYIDKALPSIDEFKEKYNAENVLYMVFFNTPYGNRVPSCTRYYYKGLEYPYEMCFIYTRYEDEDEYPATYAHEMLHTFGAADLYTAEDRENNHNINRAFVNFVAENYPNDIMYTTLDIQTDSPLKDKITNEISDITAYYIGWKDECEYVEEFGIGKSEYEENKE